METIDHSIGSAQESWLVRTGDLAVEAVPEATTWDDAYVYRAEDEFDVQMAQAREQIARVDAMLEPGPFDQVRRITAERKIAELETDARTVDVVERDEIEDVQEDYWQDSYENWVDQEMAKEADADEASI